ncbi:M20/M25/M40 family metallo-hydrolase [Marinicella meishanensis]|uniref:M20/M25/M40 family metallo-hydrolase n=1 Tax=Marinicella meishanensis TaxID=2873263 RepID=UPI001CC05581|nr:M20/M25/M40 family metallo-hydrolase [Marinicella sp. NBU2979]
MLKNTFYLALFTLIAWGTYHLSKPTNTPPDLFFDGLFFENVIGHVDRITQGPRAVGDYFHQDVQHYIIDQLQQMGLQVVRHRSISYHPKNKRAAPVANVMATIPGSDPSRPALMLMAHYDAARFAATGAGDDASGVASILEAANAHIKTKRQATNNIILLFTDAEEIGLLGALAFVNERLANQDIGLIINLEARGTSGPVMMWPETQGGNRAMIEAFAAANVPLPVTTSLHYEIYRQLPNDTDLTPFNQLGGINGFNLAFIDGHYHYHTSEDNLANLSLDTLAQQAIQTHSLLKHFADLDLRTMKSSESLVYFTIPLLGLVSYPIVFNWVLLGLIALFWLIGALSSNRSMASGQRNLLARIWPLLLSALLAYGICWLLLWLIAWWVPVTQDVMQGFPYQGHAMMLACLVAAGIITFAVYAALNPKNRHQQLLMAVMWWWLMLLPLVYHLPGAGLLIWPVLLASVLLLTGPLWPRMTEQLAPVMAVLSWLLMGSILINLPIAMGVDALPLTAVLLAWLLALMVYLISPMKGVWQALVMLAIPVLYLVAEMVRQAPISEDQPHPTSLSYLYDHDQQTGHYYNYDVTFSGWHDDLFANPVSAADRQQFSQQYRKPVRHLAQLDQPIALPPIGVTLQPPLRQQQRRAFQLRLNAHGNSQLLDIYATAPMTIHRLAIEGRLAVLPEPLKIQAGQRWLQYHFDNKKELVLNLEIELDDPVAWQLQTHSYDLLEQAAYGLSARPPHQIQKPFIASDNAVVVQSFAFDFDQ